MALIDICPYFDILYLINEKCISLANMHFQYSTCSLIKLVCEMCTLTQCPKGTYSDNDPGPISPIETNAEQTVQMLYVILPLRLLLTSKNLLKELEMTRKRHISLQFGRSCHQFHQGGKSLKYNRQLMHLQSASVQDSVIMYSVL